MYKKKKTVLLWIAVMLVALLMSACNAKPEAATVPDDVQQDETVTENVQKEQPEKETHTGLPPDAYAEPMTDPEAEKSKADLSDTELIAEVCKNLGVPEDLDITYKIGEKIYWEAGQCFYKHVEIYYGDEIVASASVSPADGKLIRSIRAYQSANEGE